MSGGTGRALRATVLIPTHDHGPTVEYSVSSALGQTLEDIEIFVVGDGVPDVTRDLMADLCRRDERVRFFDNPKGPRLGELLRHAALAEARGRIVCYLSDDDLWFPDHLEAMESVLAEADFGHTLVTWFDSAGTFFGAGVDLSLEAVRQQILEGWCLVGLSVGGHTLEAYRRLPYGWRTTPEGVWTDLYMWRQFLAEPWCRAASSFRLTVLHFPSPSRREWGVEERCRELSHFASELGRDGFHHEMMHRALQYFAEEWTRLHLGQFDRGRVGHLKIEGAAAALARVEKDLDEVRSELERMRATATWRLRDRLLNLPGFRQAARIRAAARTRAD